MIRRTSENAADIDGLVATKKQSLSSKGFSICEQTMSASFLEKPLDLTCSEFNLLKSFVSHQQRVFERNQLLERLKQQSSDCTDRAIDSHIKNLRRKLRDIAPAHNSIQSVYEVGYKFCPLPN